MLYCVSAVIAQGFTRRFMPFVHTSCSPTRSLVPSLVAYHGARYSMMMGLQRAGFAAPFSLATTM